MYIYMYICNILISNHAYVLYIKVILSASFCSHSIRTLLIKSNIKVKDNNNENLWLKIHFGGRGTYEFEMI